jgi:hypothetical protein
MTNREVIQIKEYIKGAFANMKESDFSDVVWYDLLKDEEYYGILQSVKNYIRAGNKFPPSIGEIIKGYELIIQDFANDILQEMDDDGYFDDPEQTETEIALWNKKNRKRKAFLWAEDLSKAPEWFKNDYSSYMQKRKRLFNRKMIGEAK